ncbi:hypothetical protein DPEC_G00349230 [Dallia pectoralis]|uniref:Uncharacterized protein n=1 Tax=Dallia pectoralis TaxID=75939 RepID=A0ACC2F191_DALPE|nr:hypothetical protein DPEC_G00349230 [Dallia pectoralis]
MFAIQCHKHNSRVCGIQPITAEQGEEREGARSLVKKNRTENGRGRGYDHVCTTGKVNENATPHITRSKAERSIAKIVVATAGDCKHHISVREEHAADRSV